MTWLAWYLGIGVVVLAAVFVSHRLTKKDESQSLRDLLDALNPERKTLQYRILNNIVAPVLTGALVVAVWPVALLMEGKELLSKKASPTIEKEREFSVGRGDLWEFLSVTDIEQLEKVTDPLGAVPNLPFGHLNSAWKRLQEAVGHDDEIWSFKSHWTTTWGHKELRSGYVVVRGNAIGPHFQTVWRPLGEDCQIELLPKPRSLNRSDS